MKLPGQEEDKISECQYKKGGWCLKHGDGAKRYYKTSSKEVRGPDGKVRKKYSKNEYYV